MEREADVRHRSPAGSRFALLGALGLAALGGAGALPIGEARDASDLGALAWLALWAAPAGALAARLGPAAAAPPLVWAALVASLGAPLIAATPVAGLYAGGFGFARVAGRGRAAAVLLCLGGLATALGGTGGVLGEQPWSPAVAARLLDVSPVGLVMECAGVDWMRQPAVYEPVGSSAIGPDLRVDFRGSLAGPTALVLGCALAAAGYALDRRLLARPTSE